ncbi:unnamed protein product [Zymoseptoria tritici ST99CH_3D7]|uniref:Uncharacterized protein n=1 Tax=Zymoseptoria tritici (strain ST99CH_3D7) TaxID=1276538 RepID=A0A1X7RKZ4_ZYMT9|nr:unnamed protein product [Zymoseptoria tritici ST99CH_3D7]
MDASLMINPTPDPLMKGILSEESQEGTETGDEASSVEGGSASVSRRWWVGSSGGSIVALGWLVDRRLVWSWWVGLHGLVRSRWVRLRLRAWCWKKRHTQAGTLEQSSRHRIQEGTLEQSSRHRIREGTLEQSSRHHTQAGTLEQSWKSSRAKTEKW